LIFLSTGCRQPDFGSTSTQSVTTTVEVPLRYQLFCDDLQEGVERVEVTILVLAIDLTVNPPVTSNFGTRFFDVDNRQTLGQNFFFRGIEIPESGNFSVTFMSRQSCSNCCDNHPNSTAGRLGCFNSPNDDFGGNPTWSGTSVEFMATAPPLSIRIIPEFTGCRSCGCTD
jgi:hypothetical protein